jgi:uncharacterized membrane protein
MAKALARKASRNLPLDALRGMIMIWMALDHANWFVAQQHSSGEYWGGPSPQFPDALAFLTRFVTHLSAPGFFFLMGAGMMLFARSRMELGWDRARIRMHFVLRGALLIALQLLLINRAWEFSPGGWGLEIYFGVLAALGGAMILASFMLWWRPTVLLAISLALFVGMELLHPAPKAWPAQLQGPIDALNFIFLYSGGDVRFWSNYPILAWLELVSFGLMFGALLHRNAEKTLQLAWKIGAGFLVVFMVLRILDGFGNIRPRPGDTWMGFFNLVKYPPSMTFTMLTTGINLIILWILHQTRRSLRVVQEVLAVFGRAPLFFYITHLFLYGAIGYVVSPSGMSIPRMFPLWLLGLLILYPATLWFGQLKRRQPARSVLRFL